MINRIYLLFICFLWTTNISIAQSKIERKIIIQNGQYYFFTIDEETQMAKIYSGAFKQKLNKVQKRMFPIGREFNDQFNPLAFDINGDEFVGINWILNSMNSRYEAIKKISIKDGSKIRADWTNEDWAQLSFNQVILAPNDPWEFMLADTNVLDNCFFDLMKTKVPIMAVTNQGKFWLSNFSDNKWQVVFKAKKSFGQYFTLIPKSCGGIGLLDNEGNNYFINPKLGTFDLVQKVKINGPSVLIIDKDRFKNFVMPVSVIDAGYFSSLSDLMIQSAIELK
jgi:hypothetical protein